MDAITVSENRLVINAEEMSVGKQYFFEYLGGEFVAVKQEDGSVHVFRVVEE